MLNPHDGTHLLSILGKLLDSSELKFSQLQSGFCIGVKILDNGMYLLPNGYGQVSKDRF